MRGVSSGFAIVGPGEGRTKGCNVGGGASARLAEHVLRGYVRTAYSGLCDVAKVIDTPEMDFFVHGRGPEGQARPPGLQAGVELGE